MAKFTREHWSIAIKVSTVESLDLYGTSYNEHNSTADSVFSVPSSDSKVKNEQELTTIKYFRL